MCVGGEGGQSIPRRDKLAEGKKELNKKKIVISPFVVVFIFIKKGMFLANISAKKKGLDGPTSF